MAAEVKKRLDAIDMVGRSITMKIMKRDPTAPVEPPKVSFCVILERRSFIAALQFLGHGSCDLFNKQIPLIGPGGRATSDEQIIGEHAWRLLKSFNFDPKELRGLGIQVQKLESASSTAHAPPGQAMLPFKRKGPAEAAGPSTTEPEIRVQPPSQGNNDITKIAVETSKHTVTFDLPSFSQVDMSVFHALPQDVRKELESEYKRRSASPFPNAAGPAPKPAAASTSSFLPHNKRPGAPNIFPRNPRGGRPNFKRISKQLAPRNAPAVSPGKSYLMRLLEQQKERKMRRNPKRHIPDAKLRDLNLDPEVFNLLPRRIQDEQLIMARILKEKGSLPSPPAERKILKPRKPEWPPGWVPYRPPNPKSRWVQPPFLKQYTQGQGGKKEKLCFSETDDVQRVLETWVTTYRHWAPREKDVEYLAKYLLATVDGYAASDVGVERGIAVMKWWLVLLRRFWPGSELYEEDEPDGSQTDWVGEAWWATFRKIKERMDVVARKKFGGCLSLR
jgi:DNA repair protein REV1